MSEIKHMFFTYISLCKNTFTRKKSPAWTSDLVDIRF